MAEHERTEDDEADEAMMEASGDMLKTPDAEEPAEHGPGGSPAPDDASEDPLSDASADTLKDPRADET
jgi:hypothetical protein